MLSPSVGSFTVIYTRNSKPSRTVPGRISCSLLRAPVSTMTNLQAERLVLLWQQWLRPFKKPSFAALRSDSKRQSSIEGNLERCICLRSSFSSQGMKQMSYDRYASSLAISALQMRR